VFREGLPSAEDLAERYNAVRIPLNEHCWLGINQVAVGGEAYRAEVEKLVDSMLDQGLIVVLDLLWSLKGPAQARFQEPLPNKDHSTAFWESVASRFKSREDVVFDLFSQPFPNYLNGNTTLAWECFRDGGPMRGLDMDAAGMQSVLDAVRRTGATNVVMVAGVSYGSDLSRWLQYAPVDPLGQLMASVHLFNYNECSTEECWDRTLLPVIRKVPLIVAEYGVNDCASDHMRRVTAWISSNSLSHFAANALEEGCRSNDYRGLCACAPSF